MDKKMTIYLYKSRITINTVAIAAAAVTAAAVHQIHQLVSTFAFFFLLVSTSFFVAVIFKKISVVSLLRCDGMATINRLQ